MRSLYRSRSGFTHENASGVSLRLRALTLGTPLSPRCVCLLPCTASIPAAPQKHVSFVVTSAFVDDPAGERAGTTVDIFFLDGYRKRAIDIRCLQS